MCLTFPRHERRRIRRNPIASGDIRGNFRGNTLEDIYFIKLNHKVNRFLWRTPSPPHIHDFIDVFLQRWAAPPTACGHVGAAGHLWPVCRQFKANQGDHPSPVVVFSGRQRIDVSGSWLLLVGFVPDASRPRQASTATRCPPPTSFIFRLCQLWPTGTIGLFRSGARRLRSGRGQRGSGTGTASIRRRV